MSASFNSFPITEESFNRNTSSTLICFFLEDISIRVITRIGPMDIAMMRRNMTRTLKKNRRKISMMDPKTTIQVAMKRL